MTTLETLPFSQPLTLSQSEQCLAITSQLPLRTLSSALIGDGFGSKRHFANFHVDYRYDGRAPKADLSGWLIAQGLPASSVGMMTAVRLSNASIVSMPLAQLDHGVMALVTAGVGNAVDITALHSQDPRLVAGTINVFVFIDAQLTDGALVNACMSVTEAKVKALSKAGVIDTFSGTAATGTSTDCVCVAATQRGELTPYAGSGTVLGRAIGRAVYQATLNSLASTNEMPL
ncbi:adenosylcobinamide amidohydrolase [Vreelandella neptunia]|uniref:Adenosylcobinamide amidohydrolase n=1 Tax=Vreelandella neptunia TaxID=115551 RepID=A0ABS9SA75_9GAMM|nr:adenosylcobinamide amidohydrolase [Halomonas neptunia]MCH4813012.1 adenosylcobinamide amidohydrolase [Halomonas neptunia]